MEPAGLLRDFYFELKDIRSRGRALTIRLMLRKEAAEVTRGGGSFQSGSSGGGGTGSDSGPGWKTEQQSFFVDRMRVMCERDEEHGSSAGRDRLRVEWVFWETRSVLSMLHLRFSPNTRCVLNSGLWRLHRRTELRERGRSGRIWYGSPSKHGALRVRSSLRCDFGEGPLSGITERFLQGSVRLGQTVNARDGGESKVTGPV